MYKKPKCQCITMHFSWKRYEPLGSKLNERRLCMHVDAHLGDNVLFSFIALLLIFFHVVKFASKRVKNKIWSTQLPPFSIP